MGVNARDFLHFRMEEEHYNELEHDVRERMELMKKEYEENNFQDDELWCKLKSKSIKAYKDLKNREYDLRFNFKKKSNMKYEKGKKITDVCQFKKGRKYTDEYTYEVLEFSHIGENLNPYFKDEGQPYLRRANEYNCIGFDFDRIDFYEAVEITETLDDKITELVELGKSKGLKINITLE